MSHIQTTPEGVPVIVLREGSKQNAGESFTGVDVINGTIVDFEKLGIIEPRKVKEQIIKSATETAIGY